MAFWSTAEIKQRGNQIVEPYDPMLVGHSSYEMRMGPEAYVTGRRPESGRSMEKIKLEEEGDQVAIPPGQFALLLAEERVSVPKEAIGFISIRSSYKMHGLVNVSGFHVDPGYEGHLLFAVYNAGGNHVVLSRGERVFLIWWASLTDDLDPGYDHKVEDGGREGQEAIANSDIIQIGPTAFSPAEVNRRVDELELRLKSWERLVVGLVVAIGAAVILAVIQSLTST